MTVDGRAPASSIDRSVAELRPPLLHSAGKMPAGPTGKMPVLQTQPAVQQERIAHYARTGTDAVRSSFPQLTHAPFTPRTIAFQMQ